MNIFFVMRKGVPLALQNLAKQMTNASFGKNVVCEKIDPDILTTLALSEKDMVILYGDCADDAEQLREQIAYCVENHARVALSTKLPVFRSDVPDIAYPDAGDVMVLDTARELRVRVLDLFSYAQAWYLREYESERAKMLEPVDAGRFFSQDSANMITTFIGRWLIRRFGGREGVANRLYGASMYPEVWDDEVNDHDMNLTHDIGMNAVRIGEFFWDKLEPEEGLYDMEYLEDLLERYKTRGLKVILGVPTPTPPRWFTFAHPEACLVNERGLPESHGSRQHVCTNNPDYRRKAYQLTRRIGEVASRYSNVVAIQLDNEFKCHVDLCFCEACRRRWPQWLQAHYGDIETLNSAWGTDVWSERYHSFGDVVMPVKTPFAHNSALDFAFRTFTADTLTEFASGMAQILVETTDVPLTHNTSTNFNLRNYDLFNQLDIVGFDTYPNARTPWMFPMNLGLWRNLLPGNDFLLLETCASHAGFTGNYMAPDPSGFVETEVFLGFAAGLKSFLFWLFRGQRFGVEQPHSAVITAAGTPDVGYADVLDARRMLERQLPFLEDTDVARSSVAMVYSDESRRSYHVESGGFYDYKSMVTDFYHALSKRGVDPELINANDDFLQYRCVLMPFVRNVSDQLLQKCRDFVDHGGKLILGPMTGDRTENMTWNVEDGNGLGALGTWLGLTDTVQFLSSDPLTRAEVHCDAGEDSLGGLVTMFNARESAEHMDITSRIGEGRTAIGRHGSATYIGGIPSDSDDSAFWDCLVEHEIAPYDGDADYLHTNGSVLRFRRENSDYVDFHIANMGSEEAAMTLNRPATDIDGCPIDAGTLSLRPYERQVLRFARR